MPGSNAEAVLDIRTNSGQFYADLDKAEKRSTSLGATFKSIGKMVEDFGKSTAVAGRGFETMARQADDSAKSAVVGIRAMGQEVARFSDTWKTLAAGFGTGALVSQGLGALVGWAKEAIGAAGALSDLSAKTGLTAETLQRMEAAGKPAGVALEALADAGYKLGLRISAGGASAKKAVEDLGLSWQALRQQSPDEQFAAVVKALENISDTQERNRIGTELFGKSFAGIAAAIVKGYSDIAKSATVASNEQIAALDDLGDKFDDFLRRVSKTKDIIGGSLVVATEEFAKRTLGEKFILALDVLQGRASVAVGVLNAMADQAPKEAAATEKRTKAVVSFSAELAKARAELANLSAADRAEIAAAQALGKSTDDITDRFNISEAALRLLTTATKDHGQAQRKAIESTEKWAAEGQKLLAAIDKLEIVTPGLRTAVGELDTTEQKSIETYLAKRKALEELYVTLQKLQNAQRPGHVDVEHLPGVVDIETIARLKAGFDAAKEAAAEFQRNIDAIVDSFADVAQMTGRVGAQLANIARAWQTASRAVSDYNRSAQGFSDKAALIAQGASAIAHATAEGSAGMRALGGAIAGAQIGSAFGPWGTAIGAGIGALVGALRSLRSELGAIGNALDKIGVSLPAVQQQAWDDLDATIKKYKFSLQELGPALRRQRLDEQAQEIFHDWKILAAAGIDIAAIAREMGDNINAFVQEAIRTGTEVPEALRPILEDMARMGLLTDEAGNAITDLNKSGLHFTKSLSDSFADLVKSVDRLTAAIERSLGRAGALGRAIANLPPLPGQTGSSGSSGTGAGNSGGENREAAGDYLHLMRPTRFLAGEAGREDVVFGGAGRNLARDVATELARLIPTPSTSHAGAVGGPTTVQLVVDGRVLGEVAVDNLHNGPGHTKFRTLVKRSIN